MREQDYIDAEFTVVEQGSPSEPLHPLSVAVGHGLAVAIVGGGLAMAAAFLFPLFLSIFVD
jgi:hypothetical protein